ncbi:MAG TPA: rhodanese-like domain-containing protein [Terriglobales bacterium]|jgi:hydroxyacylglutathione hydrolase|nr:rhodanese-like domain-containing protein [Terriglobales bacterium]
MYFEQFYLTCLAHASYMIGSEGEAAVIDPQRDVDIYLKAADEQNLKIRHIFETHLHADFVSGHKELAARTGAKIYIGARANAEFPHVPLTDGFEVKMGAVRIRALETPGHTPESVCLVITDETKSSESKSSESKALQPCAVLTGDTLFIGDVGRPDLSRTHTPRELAGLLYDSLHQKLLTLPDAVMVYPAHGAGSLCGRAMRAERSSTIGTERLTNYALQIASRDEFIAQLTTNLPARPEYFLEDAEINRSGAATLTELPPLPGLSPAEVQTLLSHNASVNVLDVRPGDVFAAGHVPWSINIALSGQFASWAGGILGIHSQPVLVGDTDTQIEEARLRLARVGIEELRGYLAGGVAAWQKAGLPVLKTEQISAQELSQKLRDGRVRALDVLDVRREGEWQAGHIAEVQCRALDTFPQGLPTMDRERPVAVHCKSGYRSMIACSLLERAGHRNVINVAGGFDAWHGADLPEVAEQLAKA